MSVFLEAQLTLSDTSHRAAAEGRGLHSTKEVTLPRTTDASESGSKATQFLPSWKRAGKHNAVVDFVASGSRFKLLLPKENKKLTFVLAGIRAPRTARSAGEKSEPCGPEAQRFASSRFLQRDVEIAFDSVDKQGGFIGAMYNNGQNAAVELVKAGLASVHSYSADALPFSRELYEAEESAKKARTGIWADYDEEADQSAPVEDSGAALAPEYLDVVISSVRETDPFSFSVQILKAENVTALEQLMRDFSLHHKSAKAPSGWAPKTGELVSAQFTQDDQWYRAKVKRASAMRKEAELVFIDYGNVETLPFTRIRPLDPKFKGLSGQASEARLSFVQPVPREKDLGLEAWTRFQSLTEGRKLVANIDHKEGSLLHLRLIDPTDPNAAEDPLTCINADLVREGGWRGLISQWSELIVFPAAGLATIDKTCRYASAYPQIVKKLQQGEQVRLQGDISADSLVCSPRRRKVRQTRHLRVSDGPRARRTPP